MFDFPLNPSILMEFCQLLEPGFAGGMCDSHSSAQMFFEKHVAAARAFANFRAPFSPVSGTNDFVEPITEALQGQGMMARHLREQTRVI